LHLTIYFLPLRGESDYRLHDANCAGSFGI